ncbi:MAG: c-type cytochrome [Vicinamibacterales bacterium]
MRLTIGLGLFVTVFASITAAGAGQQTPADARIWAGVYSDAQAARGKALYEQSCLRCHGEALVGGTGRRGAPPLKADRFWLDFEEKPLASLLSKIQGTMPQDAPGTLRQEDYLDVLAYILSQNGFPSGPRDLAATGLDGIPIAHKPGTVREVPNFGLVRVVGCLVQADTSRWTLTQATAPVPTRDETPTPANLADSAAASPGTTTIALLDTARFRPQPGKRVEVRGLLDKTTADQRLDVLSLAVVGGACD